MPYIGVSPTGGVRKVFSYTATAGQTSFSGSDNNSQTLSYSDSNFIDVFQNGVLLLPSDYTATTGTSVVLDTGATVSDSIQITVFDVFSVADTVSKADGGTFDGAVTFGGGVSGDIANVSGDMTIDVAGDIILDADGGDVTIKDGGTSIGAISNISSDLSIYSLTGNHKGLRFGNGQIVPTNNAGADSDNTTDLGGTSNRFKNVYLSGGIYVGGTGSANLLNDYEEGTWTPTTTSGTVTVQSNSANYVKVGKMVTVYCRLASFSDTTSGSSFAISGLPFTISVDGNDEGHVGDAWGNSMGDNRSLFFYSASGNSTSISSYYGANGNSSYNQVTYSNFDSNTNMLVKFHYVTT